MVREGEGGGEKVRERGERGERERERKKYVNTIRSQNAGKLLSAHCV